MCYLTFTSSKGTEEEKWAYLLKEVFGQRTEEGKDMKKK